MNQENNLTKRTLGREYAFKFLYKHLMPEFKEEKNSFLTNRNAFLSAITEFENSYLEKDDEHPNNDFDMQIKRFAEELIMGTLNGETEYSKNIEKFLQNKNLEKVDRMNLVVLLLGSYEIKNDKTSSPGIFINEYVNIAKKYCPPDSAGFVNSILDKIAKD